jgi:diadenosine tetraphosphate (Ap4A) HIT family hydrolase
MANLIVERVEMARSGRNPYVICHLESGWLVIGDVQPLPGYCVLLADPVVESLNALGEPERSRYSLDMIRAGDALLAVTGAYRVNYETLCNAEPALHSHLVPRYSWEAEEKRRRVPWIAYDWKTARRFDPAQDLPFMERMRDALK